MFIFLFVFLLSERLQKVVPEHVFILMFLSMHNNIVLFFPVRLVMIFHVCSVSQRARGQTGVLWTPAVGI